MKRNRRNIIASWIALLFFIVGQFALYEHQHRVNQVSAYHQHHQTAHTVVNEKCSLCDDMLHSKMAVSCFCFEAILTVYHLSDVIIAIHQVNIDLINLKGRSPPQLARLDKVAPI